MNITYELFLLFFNLTQLHNQDVIIQLFTEGMGESFKPAEFSFGKEKEKNNNLEIEIRTRKSFFGYIRVKHSEDLGDENKIILQNTVQMLAIILERLSYEQELENEKSSLENVAEIRNQELQKTNKELHRSRNASLNLIEDLTEEIEKRKQYEKELKESEERFRLVMENSLDAILITSPDGSILNANRAACNMFQMTEEDIVEAGRNGLVNMDDPNLHKMLEERKQKGFTAGELTFFRKDGTLFYGEVSTSVFKNSRDQLRTSMTIRDISERKQAEKKLKNSDRIFEHSVDMMSVSGFDGYFKTVNPAWERTLGWNTEELLSRPWNDFVHPDDIEATNSIKAEIVDGRTAYRFENRYRCKDGSYRWFSWNAFPYPEENVMFAVARDITQTRLAGEELQRLKENLEVEVEQKTKELRQRIAELERFQQATIEREFRIKELRDEIEGLKGGNS